MTTDTDQDPAGPQRRSTSLTQLAMSKIKTMIASGQFDRGQRLPREQDLAKLLGLSRGSLREAVRALAEIGILDVRVGDGTYVTSLDPDILLSPLSFIGELSNDDDALRLLDIRQILEPVATARAAGNLTPEDISRITDILDQLHGPQTAESSIRADVEFHRIILSRCGNPLLSSMLDQLSSQTLRARVWRARAESGALDKTQEEHAAIFDAVRNGEPEVAHAAATVHIAGVRHWIGKRHETGEQPGEQSDPVE